MATLSALKFGTIDGADQALAALQGLQKQQLIVIQDAAVVSWPQGAKKPKTRQTHSMAAAGAMGGAFWGMLFGLLFFIPFLGLAIGAVMGGLMGKFPTTASTTISSSRCSPKSPKARRPCFS